MLAHLENDERTCFRCDEPLHNCICADADEMDGVEDTNDDLDLDDGDDDLDLDDVEDEDDFEDEDDEDDFDDEDDEEDEDE